VNAQTEPTFTGETEGLDVDAVRALARFSKAVCPNATSAHVSRVDLVPGTGTALMIEFPPHYQTNRIQKLKYITAWREETPHGAQWQYEPPNGAVVTQVAPPGQPLSTLSAMAIQKLDRIEVAEGIPDAVLLDLLDHLTPRLSTGEGITVINRMPDYLEVTTAYRSEELGGKYYQLKNLQGWQITKEGTWFH
jgi:hypothetical protein